MSPFLETTILCPTSVIYCYFTLERGIIIRTRLQGVAGFVKFQRKVQAGSSISVRNETREKVLFDQLNDFAIYGYRRVATGMRLDFTISEKESFLSLRRMKKPTYVALHRTCKIFSQPDPPTSLRLLSIVKPNEFLYLTCFIKFLPLTRPANG